MGANKAWMPLYIGDYLADTSDLTTEEHGAYLLLLMHYWRTGPLPDDDARLRRICKLSRFKMEKFKPIIFKFFHKKDGKYFHNRMERELAKVADISEKRSEAARSRWGANASDDAMQKDTQPQSQSHIHQKEERKNTTSTAARFDEWWAQYPKKVEKKKARAIWKRRKLDAKADEIIADTLKRPEADENWKRGFIPNPTTYLNGDRWEDEYAEARPRTGHQPVRETNDERRAREADEYLRSVVRGSA